MPVTLSKTRLKHRCFPMNFAQFLRTPFLQNSSGRLTTFEAVTLNLEAAVRRGSLI